MPDSNTPIMQKDASLFVIAIPCRFVPCGILRYNDIDGRRPSTVALARLCRRRKRTRKMTTYRFAAVIEKDDDGYYK
jgi:hypothetical protein